MLPYAALSINISLALQKHAATCCLVLLLTSLCCLTNLKHCPSQKYASLYCFYSPKLSNTNITLTLETMLPHAVLYCFPLPYAALPTFHSVFLINMLPCTASYCPMLPYPYKPLTLQETCCLMLSFTASYFLMLPCLHITLSLEKHAASCCLVLLHTSQCCLSHI